MQISELSYRASAHETEFKLCLNSGSEDKVALFNNVYYMDEPGLRFPDRTEWVVLDRPLVGPWQCVLRILGRVLFCDHVAIHSEWEVRHSEWEVRQSLSTIGKNVCGGKLLLCNTWELNVIGIISQSVTSHDPFFWDQPLTPEWVEDLVDMAKVDPF